VDESVDYRFITGHQIVPVEKTVLGDFADDGDMAIVQRVVGPFCQGEKVDPPIDLFKFIVSFQVKLAEDLVEAPGDERHFQL
jgi:hypothetical protein